MILSTVTHTAESLCEKELRLLRLPVEGLAYYYLREDQEPIRLLQWDSTPSVLTGNVGSHQVSKSLPRLPSNNIMIVMITLLELSLSDGNGQKILNKIKGYGYDQRITLVDILESSERGKHTEQTIKKLFVEFFHLVASSKGKNRVEKLLYKYPIMQCAFVLLARRLLVMEGIPDAANLHLPVPTSRVIETLCLLLNINYRTLSTGVHDISGLLIAEDLGYVYLVCDKEDPPGDKPVLTDQQKLSLLLNCEDVIQIKTKPKTDTQIPMFDRANLSRPQSSPFVSRNWQATYSGITQVQSRFPLKFKGSQRDTCKRSSQVSFSGHDPSPLGSSQSILMHKQIPSHQRANTGSYPSNLENNSFLNYAPRPGLERQRSQQMLAEFKYPKLIPEKRFAITDFKSESLLTSTSPSSYFNSPLLIRNFDSVQKRSGGTVKGNSYQSQSSRSFQYGY